MSRSNNYCRLAGIGEYILLDFWIAICYNEKREQKVPYFESTGGYKT